MQVFRIIQHGEYTLSSTEYLYDNARCEGVCVSGVLCSLGGGESVPGTVCSGHQNTCCQTHRIEVRHGTVLW